MDGQDEHDGNKYVKGQARTCGIESFWALLKRGYYGVYHRVGSKPLRDMSENLPDGTTTAPEAPLINDRPWSVVCVAREGYPGSTARHTFMIAAFPPERGVDKQSSQSMIPTVSLLRAFHCACVSSEGLIYSVFAQK